MTSILYFLNTLPKPKVQEYDKVRMQQSPRLYFLGKLVSAMTGMSGYLPLKVLSFLTHNFQSESTYTCSNWRGWGGGFYF